MPSDRINRSDSEARRRLPRGELRAVSGWSPRAGLLFLCGATLLGLTGCRAARTDLIESELRKKDAQLLETKAEMNRLEALNVALMREMQGTRPGYTVESAPQFPTPNTLSYSVKKITLGRLTGGYDDDGWPGDEALEVVVEPRDPDDHIIKAPGSLFVSVVAIDPQGQKVPFGSWKLEPDELRRTWKSGLLGSGYHAILPWKQLPPSKNIRITARFTVPDGRTLEADKDVLIRPPTELKSSGAPIIVPDAGPHIEEGPPPARTEPDVEAQKPKSLWNRLIGSSSKKPIAESRPAEPRPIEALAPASGGRGNGLMDRVFGNTGKRPDWWKGNAPPALPTNGISPALEPELPPARPPLLPAQPLGRPAPITPLSSNTSEGPELLVPVSAEEPAPSSSSNRIHSAPPVSDDPWKPARPR